MKKIVFLVFLMVLSPLLVFAADKADIDSAIEKTAEYIYQTVKAPQISSVGGEWAVLGLARSKYDIPDSWYEGYYKSVIDYAKEHDGILHERKYTEYSRVILGLTAAGYNPQDIGGFDLTLPLSDFDKTVWQGINGSIFALIALDCGDYPNPNRDLYIDEILQRQLPNGGWSLTYNPEEADVNPKADPDITGMVLSALAKYRDRTEVKAAIDKALAHLSELQDDSGGYAHGSDPTSESVVQVITALCELGIDLDDPRFVKNGHSLIDNILSYQNADGSFRHTGEGVGNSQMSTEQALYGLVAAQRSLEAKNSLYRMGDTARRGAVPKTISLTNIHKDVKIMPITEHGKSFADIIGHKNQAAIEALASRSIINGKTDNAFDPNATMTRAEYAAIITRGLGLTAKPVDCFTDVDNNEWYAGYIGTAYTYGIVTGTAPDTFNPNGTITKQEAAVMTARAAKLCGMDTALDAQTIRDTLAQFGDYITVNDWARSSLAFCYKEKILPDDALDIQPNINVTRCEIAQMLYNVLLILL